MSRSVTSLPDCNESTASLTTSPNASTAELIPKTPTPASTSTTSSSSSTTVTTAKQVPATKDWEKAYGELASSMGFAGAVPLPPAKKKVKNTGKKKSGKGGETSSSSQVSLPATGGTSQGNSTTNA
ncbi:hypothetical protein BC629DRAFT_1592970 [Irpex lacteus]|nr:hypothetical protein BC629DRAFT_1592970 [Irpex lacteus]